MWTAIFAAVLSSGVATPEVSRWQVHSEVALPRPMWLVDGLVLQPRVTEVELDLALACGTSPDDDREVRCIIEDAAIRAAAMPGDEGSLLGALTQADARLTGAELRLSVKNGRVRGVALDIDNPEGMQVRRVTRARDENLRLLVSRAVSGFDLQQGELTVDTTWGQRRTWMAQLPGGRGTRAVAPLAHQVRAQQGGFQVITGGEGSMAVEPLLADGTPAAEDVYRAELRADARFDAQGRLQSRRWGVRAEPTPSSGGGDHGLLGLPYIHSGALMRLGAEAKASIGDSGVILPKHGQPSALQSDRSLGIPPVGWRG